MQKEIHLQSIIGTDKRNPLITVFKNRTEKTIDVYYGAGLFEVVADVPKSPELKHMIARLFLSGVSKKSLTDNFGYSYNAIKRWAEASKTGDPYKIIHALSGQGAPKKLTTEIQSFITHRFKSIYKENKYSYSKEIREEILKLKDIITEKLDYISRPKIPKSRKKRYSKPRNKIIQSITIYYCGFGSLAAE